MENNSYFIKKLLFPLLCLVSALGIASQLIGEAGQMMQTFMNVKGSEIAVKELWELGSILLFALTIFGLRNANPLKIFRYSLGAISLLIFSSIFIFPKTQATYLILTCICPKFLTFLGWAYINQVTTELEAKKYYFPLFGIATFLPASTHMIPTALLLGFGSIHLIIPFLGMISWLFVLLAWVCDRWISKKSARNPSENSAFNGVNPWKATLMLTVIASTWPIITILNQPAIKAYLKSQIHSVHSYADLMANTSFISGIGGLILSMLLSFWIGPRVLARKGWTFAVANAPLAGMVATLLFMTVPPLLGIPLHRALMAGFLSSWIFPLLQIAYLNYPPKTRFFMQGFVSLVAVPLLVQSAKWLSLLLRKNVVSSIGALPTSIAAFAIFGLMMICALKMKKITNIFKYEQNQRI
jgi:hypothetical protein